MWLPFKWVTNNHRVSRGIYQSNQFIVCELLGSNWSCYIIIGLQNIWLLNLIRSWANLQWWVSWLNFHAFGSNWTMKTSSVFVASDPARTLIIHNSWIFIKNLTTNTNVRLRLTFRLNHEMAHDDQPDGKFNCIWGQAYSGRCLITYCNNTDGYNCWSNI